MLGSIASALQNARSARGYEKLNIVPPINGTKCCHEPQKPWLAYRLFQLMTIMLLASTTILAILYSMTFKSPADWSEFTKINDELLTCGKSVAEAKDMGCHFDLLAKAWLPAACPRHGLADFTTSVKTALMGIGDPNGNDNGVKSEVNQWRYYSAKHNGREISIDELAAMADHLHDDTQYWTTRREHSVHCAWMLLRLAHVYTNGLRGDHMVRRYEHARHCVHNLLGKAMYAPGQDEIATHGNVVFGNC